MSRIRFCLQTEILRPGHRAELHRGRHRQNLHGVCPRAQFKGINMRTFGNGLGKKDPGETVTLTFDFSADLATGETLTGTPACAIALKSGVAAAEIGSMLQGAAQMDGPRVLQMCRGGMMGHQYDIHAACSTSSGRRLVVGAILPVVNAAMM